jgi:hypothetical protein
MRIGQVVACMSATAWVSGNALLVSVAPRLFAHAPTSEHPGGTHDFVSHEAAGAVFGDALLLWSGIVTSGLLPALVIGVALCFFASLKRRHSGAAMLWLLGILLAGGMHAWSAAVMDRANDLLIQLRAGQAEGSRWSDFHALHRQSRVAMSAETLAGLALALAAAVGLARREASAPAGGE